MSKILVFGASWCKHCTPHKENLKRLGFEFIEVDSEAEYDLVERFKIKNLPTTLLVRDGKECFRCSGTMNDVQIETLKRALAE